MVLGYVLLFSHYRWPRVKGAKFSRMASNFHFPSSRYKPGEYFRRCQLKRIAASQPGSLETEQDFMEREKRPRGRINRQESP